MHLEYEAYEPRAIATLQLVAEKALSEFDLSGVAIVHRLGTVPVGEESIIVAVSCAHRRAAWRAGEWILEEVKEKAEIWKKEQYREGNAWKSNADVK